jgi:hypothetical protein
MVKLQMVVNSPFVKRVSSVRMQEGQPDYSLDKLNQMS